MLYYVARNNIAIAIPLLKKEFSWTDIQLGFISGCLFWAYAFSHLLWGRISDKVGGRLLVTIGGLLSSIVNLFCSFANTVATLATLWAINGLFQAMGWSPGTRLVTNWWSKRKRGFSMGVLLSLSGSGTAVAWLLGGWAGNHFGWQGIFRIPPLFRGNYRDNSNNPEYYIIHSTNLFSPER
ncbi:MAG: MFS transporter [Candidatus Asgardarchaeia archaeon]